MEGELLVDVDERCQVPTDSLIVEQDTGHGEEQCRRVSGRRMAGPSFGTIPGRLDEGIDSLTINSMRNRTDDAAFQVSRRHGVEA
jgi:hypothetical protein